MKNLGLRTIVMTGDREENAARFGFDECLAGLTPAAKLHEVEKLRAAGRKVLFIGDGINDAPAMAAATASIAMGTGSELPRETAGLELNGQDLRVVPQSIALCRATVRAIRRNIAFAACYNIFGIGLAAAGILHPIAAALIMLVSSLTVTWRVLRETSDTALQKAAAQRTARSPPARAWDFPQIERLVFAATLALQGPVIAWLGGFHGAGAAGFVILFLAAGAAVLLWSRDRVWSPAARMTMAMFSVGGLAMLAGWWADAGFAAVVRDGVCLCGCIDSSMGLGLLAKFTWMEAGMLAAALPGLFIERDVIRGLPSPLLVLDRGLDRHAPRHATRRPGPLRTPHRRPFRLRPILPHLRRHGHRHVPRHARRLRNRHPPPPREGIRKPQRTTEGTLHHLLPLQFQVDRDFPKQSRRASGS